MLFSNKDLRRLFIPLILEQALSLTVGMADTMMISSVGEAAVSGVSLVDMLNNLIFNILAALATGGAVVTSQCIGAGNKEEANHSARQLVFTSIILGFVIMLLMITTHRPLLKLFFGSIEEDVMNNAIIYLIISAVSFPFLGLYNSCAAVFRSMGNSKITLKVSVLMNIINVLGNAICILGLRMGVAGVAIPSLVSRAVAALILYLLLKNPKHMIHLPKEPFIFEPSVVKKILYIGIPSGIENGIFQLGRVLVVSIIAGFGTVQIAANGVANSLDGIAIIPGQAMSLAMITVIGRCVGAGDEKQIRYYTKKLIILTHVFTILINLILLPNLSLVLSIYGLGKEALELSYILVMIHNGSAMLLWPWAFVLPNMLRACNDVRFTMVVSIFSMMTFRVGFSYIFGVHMGMGALGVWIAMIMDWIFRIGCFVARYFRGTWKKKCYLVETGM